MARFFFKFTVPNQPGTLHLVSGEFERRGINIDRFFGDGDPSSDGQRSFLFFAAKLSGPQVDDLHRLFAAIEAFGPGFAAAAVDADRGFRFGEAFDFGPFKITNAA